MNDFGSTRVPDATYQISRPVFKLVQEKKIFKCVPYMYIAVMLVMLPEPFEDFGFVPLTPGGVTIGPVSFEM